MSHHTPDDTELHDRNGSHLEALLRQEERVIPDAGFTERVMAALPSQAAGSRWRPWILAGSGLLAALVGVLALLELGLPLARAADSPLAGGRILDWTFRAFTWSPDALGASVPVVPFALGLVALGLVFLWTRSNATD